jgi:hypothetical protein
MKGTIEAAAPLQHYKKMKISCLQMLHVLYPTLSLVGKSQQHQPAQQQQNCAASFATTSGEIFSYHPPSVLRASIKETTPHIISTAYLNRKILLPHFPLPPPFPRIRPFNLFRLRRKGCFGPWKVDRVNQLSPRI